jgi:hypothetical protein
MCLLLGLHLPSWLAYLPQVRLVSGFHVDLASYLTFLDVDYRVFEHALPVR